MGNQDIFFGVNSGIWLGILLIPDCHVFSLEQELDEVELHRGIFHRALAFFNVFIQVLSTSLAEAAVVKDPSPLEVWIGGCVGLQGNVVLPFEMETECFPGVEVQFAEVTGVDLVGASKSTV